MNLALFAIRPEPGLSATIAAAGEQGLAVAGCPLFEIRSLPWVVPRLAEIDGLLIGSANAIRHGDKGLASLRGKPAWVVGEATAVAARAAGLEVALVGRGGLQQVLDTLAGQHLRLLRIAGAEHVTLAPPDGITLVIRVAYASVALPMPDEWARRLQGGGVVLLHSAAAARHFAGECARLGIAREHLRLAALGPRIAQATGAGWAEVRSAQTPDDVALLALARDMCQ